MTAPTLADKLVVAISSRALFDLAESHRIYVESGVEAYQRFQIEHEDEVLAPGPAFGLVTKLLRLNRPPRQYVEVILLSRNSADTGLRVFNSIKHYGLAITRAAFTRGESTSRYVPAFGAHLFLSADTGDVRRALEDGYAAATIFPSVPTNDSDELRIAFDGDAVLFSDEAERIYQSEGLAAFSESERNAAATPLSGGPFKEFLAALHRIQAEFPEETSPIRTALVTARGAPAHERVIRTLRAWNIRIDEALFLGGLDKGEFLRAFGADIYFDDQQRHVESAAAHVPAGHVPHGVANDAASAGPGAAANPLRVVNR
ncbi:MAG TPA: 5'-nucleotidase [Casimicrobiaceae bacterium]